MYRQALQPVRLYPSTEPYPVCSPHLRPRSRECDLAAGRHQDWTCLIKPYDHHATNATDVTTKRLSRAW